MCRVGIKPLLRAIRRARLPSGDSQLLKSLVRQAVSTPLDDGNPSKAICTSVQLTYSRLGATAQRSLLGMLAEHLGTDDNAVGAAASKLLLHQGGEARVRAHDAMRQALSPLHESVLRAIGRQRGGLSFLMSLRADVLVALAEAHQRSAAASADGATPATTAYSSGARPLGQRPSLAGHGNASSLACLNGSLLRILSTAFDPGNLEFRRIQWEVSPAALLDKLLRYERVHPMRGWEDLRARLGVGRRVFALMHPQMPLEPLVFVEAALCQDLPRRLVDVMPHRIDLEESLDGGPRHPQAPDAVANPTGIPMEAAVEASGVTEADPMAAVFYSISAPSDGLRGVPLGR